MNETNRYQQGKIYTIRNYVDDEVYVGSTCMPLAKRLYGHKIKSKNNYSNMSLYKHVQKIGGWDQFYIELYENYPCATIQDLYQRRGQVQRKLKSSLNKAIPEKDPQEYGSQVIACECGQTMRRDYLSWHQKSKKHEKLMTANIVEQIRQLNERLVELQNDKKTK
jgi:hypothetical protein